MIFQKRKRAEEYQLSDDEDVVMYDYEDHVVSDDDNVEEIQINERASTQQNQRPNEKKNDPKSKPLLDEVLLQGAATGKNPGGTKRWECKHCKGSFKSSYTRIHYHFFGAPPGKKADIKRCPAMLKSNVELQRIRNRVQSAEREGVSSSLKNSKLTRPNTLNQKNPLVESFATMDRHAVDEVVVKALCACGIPFNVLRNPEFCHMLKVVNNAPKGYKPPSYEKARTTLLDGVKTSVEKQLLPVKETWYTDGVSIVSDGWSNVKKNPLINILGANSSGAVFLYAVNCAGDEKTGQYIADILLKSIDEVGPNNVVQVVTDNASNCKAAGRIVQEVHPHIFWSPCVIHTLNLVFKDLARDFDWFRDTYSKGKQIVKFFLNHTHALTVFRTNSKLELLKVAKTRFASHYIMLKRLIDVKEALVTTVVLQSWKDLLKSVDQKSREIGNLIADYVKDDFFWEEVSAILEIVKPIYKLIRFCDKDGPIMSEIYEGMDDMLGEIRDVMKNNKYADSYAPIEATILSRWEKMNVPIHCLGFALSPRYYDSHYVSLPAPGGTMRRRPNEDKEVMKGVFEAFDKLTFDDPDAATLLRKQFVTFHRRKGLFSLSAALADATVMNAIEWWGTYGSETPELAEVTRKILAQPITTSSAERNWSTYSYIHNVKRNRLNSARADKLVFIHSNIRLLSRFGEEYDEGPYKRYDVDPESTLIDDSNVRLEELGRKSLEDDGKDIQEEEDIPTQDHNISVGSSSHHSKYSKQATTQVRTQQSQILSFTRRSGGHDKGKGLA